MKLHDLRPAEGAHKARTRVGRGIAAGKGKTAGRGTKGQKARAGGSIPPWFEGGQTPLHMRIPKLRGFKNRFRIEYEVVNVGAIGELVERGAFETEAPAKGAKAQGRQRRPDHDQPGHPARRRARADPRQAAQDPRRRRAVGAALRRRRCVHRVRPDEDRGGRRQRQRPRGPDHQDARRSRPARAEADAEAEAAPAEAAEATETVASPRRPAAPAEGARRPRKAPKATEGREGGRRGRRREPPPSAAEPAAEAAAEPEPSVEATADAATHRPRRPRPTTASDEAETTSGDDA